MPVTLFSFKKNTDGTIMFHGFLAPSDKVAEKMEKAHAAICPHFGPALAKGETIEQLVDVDTLPEFDEDSIGEWLDEMFGLEDEEEDAEEEDAEEQDQEEENEPEPE